MWMIIPTQRHAQSKAWNSSFVWCTTVVASNLATISFKGNNASLAGSNLFGGLLDRCIVSPFARLNIYAVNAYRRSVDGITYF